MKERSSHWREKGRKGETVCVCVRKRESDMRGGGERETRKSDEEMVVEGADEEEEEEVTAVERGVDLTLLVHLDRRL